MKIELKKPCAFCLHFDPMVDDDNRRLGFALPPGGAEIGGRLFDAMGVGHCEHPEKPRGLVMATYHCDLFERNERKKPPRGWETV